MTRVVTNPANRQGVTTTTHTAERKAYAVNQRTVTYAIGETWTWDGDPPRLMFQAFSLLVGELPFGKQQCKVMWPAP